MFIVFERAQFEFMSMLLSYCPGVWKTSSKHSSSEKEVGTDGFCWKVGGYLQDTQHVKKPGSDFDQKVERVPFSNNISNCLFKLH